MRRLRIVEADESGPEGAPGLALLPMAGIRLRPDTPYPGMATILIPDGSDTLEGLLRIEIPDPINLAFTGGDDGTYQLLLLDHSAGDLIEVEVQRPGGSPRFRTFRVGGVSLVEPAGMALDPTTGDLFILDAARGTLVRLEGGRYSRSTEIPLPTGLAALTDLRGLALDPLSQHLYLLSPAAGEIYEVDADGNFHAQRQLPELGAFSPLAMTFGASWDATDAPERTHLYLATFDLDTGSPQVTEWTFVPSVGGQPQASEPALLLQSSNLSTASLTTPVSDLEQTIDSSSFIPPSPDSAGIAYQASRDSMLMSDSEVNEMSIYQGVNMFEHDRFGTLLDTFDTTTFSDEPTGVAIDPANGFCFLTDDTGTRSVHVLDPGPDQVCLTSDDSISSFPTGPFGSRDPEGLAFCQGSLFVADGVNAEFYEIQPGSNGIFDGVAPGGDDLVTSCDTTAMGVQDPEGIACDDSTGWLYLIGEPTTLVIQASQDCDVLATIDVSAANADKPSGLALAPSSVTPSVQSLWITDRGTDNGKDPNENDGRVYEMSLPPSTPGNTPPVVGAGPDQNITLGDGASLQGSVTDDGIPGGLLSSEWAQVAGGGIVSFADTSQPATTATFSDAGSYRLRLRASDGELLSGDELDVAVAMPDGSLVFELRIQDRLDDAEEAGDGSGNVSRGSGDLELVVEDGWPQTVAIRFPEVDLPAGSIILDAWVQFKVEDDDSPPGTVLTIEGDSAVSASPILKTAFDISSRARTSTSVTWQPPPWPNLGEAWLDQRTPDLSPIIQELVDQVGWSSGNAIAFIITGTGVRTAESVDGDPSGAPLLHVVYWEQNTPPSVSITTPADGTTEDVGSLVGLTGTASDTEDG
ncbi:MAG: hypothetical protein ABFS46_07385, partial [Myxococcota bacterium]